MGRGSPQFFVGDVDERRAARPLRAFPRRRDPVAGKPRDAIRQHRPVEEHAAHQDLADVLASEDRFHARHGACFGGVDTYDLGVGKRADRERGPQLVRPVHVGRVLHLTGDLLATVDANLVVRQDAVAGFLGRRGHAHAPRCGGRSPELRHPSAPPRSAFPRIGGAMAVQIATRIIDGDGHILEDHAGSSSTCRPSSNGSRTTAPTRCSRRSITCTPGTRSRRHRCARSGPRSQRNCGRRSSTTAASNGPRSTRLEALAYGRSSAPNIRSPCRAYNDWLYAAYTNVDKRFKGIAIIDADPAAAVLELRRAVTELGFTRRDAASNGLAMTLGSKYYWPVYGESERLGCGIRCTVVATTGSGWISSTCSS